VLDKSAAFDVSFVTHFASMRLFTVVRLDVAIQAVLIGQSPLTLRVRANELGGDNTLALAASLLNRQRGWSVCQSYDLTPRMLLRLLWHERFQLLIRQAMLYCFEARAGIPKVI